MKELKKEKEIAVRLRKEGKSLNDICAVVKRGKGTVYPWIRNIDVEIKRKYVRTKNHILATERMQRNYRKKREKAYDKFWALAPKLLADPRIRDFIVAYYCEGAKTGRHRIDFTNTDPSVHKLFLNVISIFTKKEPKFRLTAHNCTDEMLSFWKKELKIKDIMITEKGGNKSKFRSKFGTLKIYVDDTYGLAKIYALMDYVINSWNKDV